MKYFVNDTCIGCGLCSGICPSVFHMGDEGMAAANEEEINAADAPDAEEAMNSCPVGAIERQ